MTTTSTYIRLAGPLQSWAVPSVTGMFVRTASTPTYTALQGVVAAAFGYPRDAWPTWISQLTFEVRIDDSGSLVDDFHTIAPHEDEIDFKSRLLLAMGKRPTDKILLLTPDAQKGTAIVRRTYIANGEFLIRIIPPKDAPNLERLRDPVFSIYLGRKAFPASFPFYLGNSEQDLLGSIPRLSSDTKSTHETTFKQVFTPELDRFGSAPTYRIRVPVVHNRSEWLSKMKTVFQDQPLESAGSIDYWDTASTVEHN